MAYQKSDLLHGLVFALLLAVVRGQESASTCAGPTTAAVFVTLLICLLVFAIIVFLQRRKGAAASTRKSDPESTERAAYSNPSFEPDVTDNGGSPNTTAGGVPVTPTKANEKGLSTLERVMAAVRPGSKSSLTRTLDDTSRKSGGEESIVPLHATDFAGLGFSVAGTLRDGIYVKDLLNKGPAALSGKVKPGDRLLALTVVTEHCAQDDAINLLSYASPYPVLLHLVRSSPSKTSSIGLNLSSSLISPNSSSKVELRENETAVPVHPSFRSQSSGDLTKIAPEDRTTNQMRIGGNIAVAHTRISDSAIDQLTHLTRNKLQGRHSERAIDVPEAALKPSSAYGNLRPGSSQDMEIVASVNESENKMKPANISMSKLGVKVLPDITILKRKDDNIQDKIPEVSSESLPSPNSCEEEQPKIPETNNIPDIAKDDFQIDTVIAATNNLYVQSPMLADNERRSSVEIMETSITMPLDRTIEAEVSEHEDVVDSHNRETTVNIEDAEIAVLHENIFSNAAPVPLERRSLNQQIAPGNVAISMLTDDEAVRPAIDDHEAEPTNVLSFTETADLSGIRPRTDDEKENARRTFGFEFVGRRNYMLEGSGLEDSPECDENKILMDVNVMNINDDALETANRAAFGIDILNESQGNEPIGALSQTHTNVLEFDLLRNKTDQVKDEEFSANFMRNNSPDDANEENSETEDAVERRSPTESDSERLSRSKDRIPAEMNEPSTTKIKEPTRRVSSPNDRANIFGMYVNHEFEGPLERQESDILNTGTKPKTFDNSHNDENGHHDEHNESGPSSNDSFIAARNFFSAKSELKFLTDVPKEPESRDNSSIFDPSDTDEDKQPKERKVSLLNFEITKPKRSTLELEVSPTSVEPKISGFTFKETHSNDSEMKDSEHVGSKYSVESDLPEADSDLKKQSQKFEEEENDFSNFGVAFGFKGFKKRIGRSPDYVGENVTDKNKITEPEDIEHNMPPKEHEEIPISSSVSALKMSFETKSAPLNDEQEFLSLKDLPESEASFSRDSVGIITKENSFETVESLPIKYSDSEENDRDSRISTADSSPKARKKIRNRVGLALKNFVRSSSDTDEENEQNEKISEHPMNDEENRYRVKEKGAKSGFGFGFRNRSRSSDSDENLANEKIDQNPSANDNIDKKTRSKLFPFKLNNSRTTSDSESGEQDEIRHEMSAERPTSEQKHKNSKLGFKGFKNLKGKLQTEFSKRKNDTFSSDDEAPKDVSEKDSEDMTNDDSFLSNEGDSIDSDEVTMSRAAMAVMQNRGKKNKRYSNADEVIADSKYENCTLNLNRAEQVNKYKLEVGKLVTGSIDVEVPEVSSVEVHEVIKPVNINHEKDIVPGAVTGLDSVTISGTSVDISELDANNYTNGNLIRVDSGDYLNDVDDIVDVYTKIADHVVKIPNIENDKVEVTVNSRRSLTDSEELKRKAASLGDLSQIPDNQEDTILERAVSLEFKSNNEENCNNLHTHRISLPNASGSSIDEVEEHVSVLQMNQNDLSNVGIKRAAMWGTLDDAHLIRQNSNNDVPVNGHSVAVQTQRRRDYRASSLEGLPSSVARSNSTKLMVHQPHVTVRSNPTLSLSTVDLKNKDDGYRFRNEYNTKTFEGGTISNIEISDGHGVSVTSLTHSSYSPDEARRPFMQNSVSTSNHDGTGATTIRVLESYSAQPDSQVLVVDTNHVPEQRSFGTQFTSSRNSLTVSPGSYANDMDSEVTVTTVSGSGKTSFITGSSPPDLVPVQHISGDWNHVNGDYVRISSDDDNKEDNHQSLPHRIVGGVKINKSDALLSESGIGTFKVTSDTGPNSMTQITVDGSASDYQANDLTSSRTVVIPASASISITQQGSPPPFLEPPYQESSSSSYYQE